MDRRHIQVQDVVSRGMYLLAQKQMMTSMDEGLGYLLYNTHLMVHSLFVCSIYIPVYIQY